MRKPYLMLLKRPFNLLIVLIMAAVLMYTGGLPVVAQEDTANPVGTEEKPAAPEEKKEAPSEPSAEAVQPEAAEPVLPPPSISAEKWVERYDQLVAGLSDRSLDEEDADKLYQDVDEALEKMRNRLRNTLTSLNAFELSKNEDTRPDDPSNKEHSGKTPQSDKHKDASSDNFQLAEQQSADLVVLYKLRTELLPLVSPSIRDAVTGTGIEGVRAFKEEIDYLFLMLRVRLHLMPRAGSRSLDRVTSAPVPVLLVLLQFTFACFVFYWWRRWAKTGIPNLRTTILGIKPRIWLHSWTAKILWYVNRIRSPVEWALLIYVLLGIIKTSRGRVILDLLWTNARLILIAWFVVLLVDAMSTRGAAGLRSGTAKLRLRSFWLFAAWALVISLGLGITEDLAGKGTTYAWVWVLSKLLILPVVFLLVRWWRPEIYQSLEEVTHPPVFIEKILKQQKGIAGFFGAGLGACYLIWKSLRQLLLKVVTKFEGGRYLIANLTRLEAIKASEREPQRIKGDPISEELRDKFFEDDGGTVESVGQNALDQMVGLVEKEKQGMAVVVVEHGGGKSFLLKRLADRFEGQVLSFSCPPGHFHAFKKAFTDALDLGTTDPAPDIISRTLKAKNITIIAVDNIHRLSRPAFGGQEDMDKMADLLQTVDAPVYWFFTLDWSAWQYISRVRDSSLFLNKVIRMPLWSEEQIKELIERRSAHAGIEPDFSELVLPRQFEDDEHETVEERNRFGFFRILWNASDGNPVASLNLWTDALRIADSGTVRVALPQLPEAGELDNVSMTVLLTLRVIAQSSMATPEQIIDSLRLPADEVNGALTLARNRAWIELIDGHYRLNWRWFRSIMRVLGRQNLLVRK